MTGTRNKRKGDSQEMPIPNNHEGIQNLVIEDIEKRIAVGVERYGTVLQPFNGRDALLDLYEELLDAVVYTKQLLVEMEYGDKV